MSIEGPGLYQDDTGHDVRSEFRNLIGAGQSPEEATTSLVDSWSDVLDDEDVFCAFYLALADSQWRLGRLVLAVRDEAIKIIESGRDLKRWEYNPDFHKKRLRVLRELRTRLAKPPPAARPIRKQADFATTLELGDLVRYIASSGESFLLAVIGVVETNRQLIAIVRGLEWNGMDPVSASSGVANHRLMPGTPLALYPHCGVDLPAKRSKVVLRGWEVPEAERQTSLVGCSLVSWGVNLDWQLPPRQSQT